MGSLGFQLVVVVVAAVGAVVDDGEVNETRPRFGGGEVQYHGGGSYGGTHKRRILLMWGQQGL